MDIFQTIVTSSNIIYTFVDSYAASSKESRSLAVRLEWDLRILQQFNEYFLSRQAQNGGQLPEADFQLCKRSAEYLQSLVDRVTSSARKIQSKTWLGKEANKVLWWHRQSELQKLEEELFEWTRRLDLRLVAVPQELKNVIKLDSEGLQSAANASSPNFIASTRIQQLQHATSEVRASRIDSLYAESPPENLKNVLNSNDGEGFRTAVVDGETLLIERRFHVHAVDSGRWLDLRKDLGDFVSALHCLDSTTVSLLHCKSFFHNSSNAIKPSFNLVHTLPFSLESSYPPTLKSLITTAQGSTRLPAAHPLDSRFALAQSLSTALFFLHSVDFVHKSIESRNVLMLERPDLEAKRRFPYALGDPFLVGFDSLRSDVGFSDHATQVGATGSLPSSSKLYQHPNRIFSMSPPRYQKAHDVYSLGMVLLEVGLWRPLERYERGLLNASADIGQKQLKELTDDVAISMGRRYKELVCWCLSLQGDESMGNLRFAREVLGNLEDMVSALR
jgi:hypothetical protein